MYMKGTLSNFVYNYYMLHKADLQKIKTPLELYNQFKPGEAEWQQLLSYAGKDSIDISGIPAPVKADILQQRIPAMLARQIWRAEGYFEVNNQNDAVVKKALAVLN